MKKSIQWMCIIALSFSTVANAQFFKKLKKKVDKKLKQTEQKIEQKVDKSVDDLLFSSDSTTTDSTRIMNDEYPTMEDAPMGMDQDQSINQMDVFSQQENLFESYTKYDFIPGADLKVMEDFTSTFIGDFPSTWNTDSSAEVVEMNAQPGKWLQIGNGSKTLVMNDIIDNWEEDFTLEFDIAHDFPQESAFKRHFDIILSDLKDANSYLSDAYEGKAYTYLRIGAGGGSGYGILINKKAKTPGLNATSKTSYDAFYNQSIIDKVHHVAIVKKGLRIKMYVNEEKVIDMMRALDPAAVYSTLRFGTNISPDDQHFYISNIKYAGDVEIPQSLFENGSYQAHGITFDTGTTIIKPESAGVLKRLSQEMAKSSNTYEIIGHTDTDGDELMNQQLSENRANAVKYVLINQYGVDASRLTTSGKGENAPIFYGEDSVSKAQNRRVEIKQL
ncbi:OmpA family protein [Nonlabens sp. Asnod3-H03]|uniref:OmpA family protein n=1 Tax=Nonlabens sp. Asnod3-H03 TaxID=3160580 RepID=UPI00386B2EE3